MSEYDPIDATRWIFAEEFAAKLESMKPVLTESLVTQDPGLLIAKLEESWGAFEAECRDGKIVLRGADSGPVVFSIGNFLIEWINKNFETRHDEGAFDAIDTDNRKILDDLTSDWAEGSTEESDEEAHVS